MNGVWFWALLAVVLVGLYLSQVAGRLDRLHIRVDNAASSLDAQLLRRSSAALELAASGLLDPATSLFLSQAAHDARRAEGASRSEAENDLTVALAAALPDADAVAEIEAEPGGDALIVELAATAKRVELADAFLNDAVRSCVLVRKRPIVRGLRLAGRAPWPAAMALDVSAPDALAPRA